MGGVERVFVSHHQFLVTAGFDEGRDSRLDLYTVGDGLVHLTGRSELTAMTGPHTGWVEVGLEVLAHPPGPDPDEWEAVSEATLWCPRGRIAVSGLMGHSPDQFRDVPVSRPGLLRVRIRTRGRRPEHGPAMPEPESPERHEVLVWPADEEIGLTTLRQDGIAGSDWSTKPGRAATWAMVRLVALANPDPWEVHLRRHAPGRAQTAEAGGVESTTATIRRRSRVVPASTVAEVLRDAAARLGLAIDGDTLVLPIGDVVVRVIPTGASDGSAFVAQWRWEVTSATTAVNVPEPGTSRVELRAESAAGPTRLEVIHRGVAAPHAVLVGLLWDYLLERVVDGQAGPYPWVEVFERMAAEAAARAEAARRRRESREARLWGGTPPSDRLRQLAANTIMLSNMDRPLLDALAEATPEQQRAVARWATWRACAVAGLAGVDWITAALAALDRGEPLPPPFDDADRAWQRLFSDRRIRHTVVTTPDGTPNVSQQALAFPTITQATNDDPLAAAVDALAAAMYAYGPALRDLAADCRSAFPTLQHPAAGST